MVVTGQDTNFSKEIQPYDVILVRHPSSGEEENRIVQQVVSNSSLILSSPFNNEMVTYIPFRFARPAKESRPDYDPDEDDPIKSAIKKSREKQSQQEIKAVASSHVQ